MSDQQIVEQALQQLGLTAIPDSKELRRAYLRAVKEHPPERDPEGFQRVRQAYELVTARLERAAVMATLHEAKGPREVATAPVATTTQAPDRSINLENVLQRASWLLAQGHAREAVDRALPLLREPVPNDVAARDECNFALQLLSSGERDEAVRFIESLIGARADRRSASLVMLAELFTIREQLGPELVFAIATALRTGDPGEADLDLRLSFENEPRRRKLLQQLFAAQAPTLLALYDSALRAPPLYARTWQIRGALAVMLLIVLRVAIYVARGYDAETPRKLPDNVVWMALEERAIARKEGIIYSAELPLLSCMPINHPLCATAASLWAETRCAPQRRTELDEAIDKTEKTGSIHSDSYEVLGRIHQRAKDICTLEALPKRM